MRNANWKSGSASLTCSVKLEFRSSDFEPLTGHPEVGLFGVNLTGNALPFLVTYGVSSALSRRCADNPSNWITSEWPTT